VRGEIHSDYIHASLHPQRRADKIKAAVEALQSIEFDAIAVRGMSGAIIGGAIAHALGKPIILVRKHKYNEESHHSCMQVEGPLHWNPRARYVIVDDFVSSGLTFRRIQAEIDGAAECVGAYLYRDEEYTAFADFPDRWLPHEKPAEKPETKTTEAIETAKQEVIDELAPYEYKPLLMARQLWSEQAMLRAMSRPLFFSGADSL
jgi:orotate phosphoribosyltransferase